MKEISLAMVTLGILLLVLALRVPALELPHPAEPVYDNNLIIIDEYGNDVTDQFRH